MPTTTFCLLKKIVRSPQYCNRWVPLYVSSLRKRFCALLCRNCSRICKYLVQSQIFFLYILAPTFDALILACQRSRFALSCDVGCHSNVIIQRRKFIFLEFFFLKLYSKVHTWLCMLYECKYWIKRAVILQN